MHVGERGLVHGKGSDASDRMYLESASLQKSKKKRMKEGNITEQPEKRDFVILKVPWDKVRPAAAPPKFWMVQLDIVRDPERNAKIPPSANRLIRMK